MRSVIQAFSYLLAPTAKRFERAIKSSRQSQLKVQQKLIDQLKRCEYGKKYQIRSIEDWHKLPVVSYGEIAPWIARSKGNANVISSEEILFYEPTSGSSGPKKQIPYTAKLRQSFNHLFCIWAWDLIRNGPTFSTGKIYFSITPSFSKDKTTGTNDDSDYLDPWLRWILSPFLVTAPTAKTPEAFQQQLVKTLLLAEALEIISIWSPSFLTAQLKYIQKNAAQLQKLLKGKISKERSHLLTLSPIPYSQLWPHLKLISCWDSTTAADSAKTLRSHFPNTLVQGKGLLATEAPITVPILAAKGHVPLVDQIYFEFEDDSGQYLELHQLTVGKTYELIISQMGGLYRYRIGDFVRVTHLFHQTPCLEFCGRGKNVSDMVGEKLPVDFVSKVIDQLKLPEASYQTLVPMQQPDRHYLLLLDRCDRDPSRLAIELETLLCQSFHYKLARQLNQLEAAKVRVYPTISEQLTKHQTSLGRKLGDIKHSKLLCDHPFDSLCHESPY